MKEEQKDYKFLTDIVASEKDLDIRAYTRKIKEELTRLEDDCITDFLTINQQVGTLYSELNQSNKILSKIEGIVDSFQNELSDIASQVSIIQVKSQSYNTKLKNRKQLEQIMSNHIQGIFLTEDLIRSLSQDNIDSTYLENVAHLNQILLNSKNPELSETKSYLEIKQELDNLRLMVCGRARAYLIVKMNNLRKPKTNFQILQESVLLKYKPLLAFLKQHSQETFVELTNYYSDVMNKIYYYMIKTYIKETKKLIEEIITKHDHIVCEDIKPEKSSKTLTQAFEFINTLGQQRHTTQENRQDGNGALPTEPGVSLIKKTPFIVDDRLSIISKIDSQPIVSTISSTKQHHFTAEDIFRSQNRLIIEAVSKEFVFILEFFDLKVGQCSYIFNQIFSKIINYYLEWLSQYTSSHLYDIYAVLLMTVVNEENKKLIHKSKISVLDFYFDKINMMLWPRFTHLFDALVENIKKTQMKNYKLYNQTIVHASTAKFADFHRSINLILPYLSQDMVAIRLNQLKQIFIEFLEQLALNHFSEEKDQRSFMTNNLDFIINSGKSSTQQTQDVQLFQNQMTKSLQNIIQSLFRDHFYSMQELVLRHCHHEGLDEEEKEEDQAKQSKFNNLQSLNSKMLDDVAHEFQLNYRAKIDIIKQELKHSIQNGDTKIYVYQKFMRSLMLKYSSMIELIKQSQPALLKEITPPHVVLLDLKNQSNIQDF